MSRKKKMQLVYLGVDTEFTQQDSIDYWQSLTPKQRLDATWQLAVDAWSLKGKSKDELRFQRSTALFKRRKS